MNNSKYTYQNPHMNDGFVYNEHPIEDAPWNLVKSVSIGRRRDVSWEPLTPIPSEVFLKRRWISENGRFEFPPDIPLQFFQLRWYDTFPIVKNNDYKRLWMVCVKNVARFCSDKNFVDNESIVYVPYHYVNYFGYKKGKK